METRHRLSFQEVFDRFGFEFGSLVASCWFVIQDMITQAQSDGLGDDKIHELIEQEIAYHRSVFPKDSERSASAFSLITEDVLPDLRKRKK